ncbi:MAG: hypothetical protein IKV92_02275 [Akkermansia sp.]|nr:hypothetical protein [Akkermansia sp.]
MHLSRFHKLRLYILAGIALAGSSFTVQALDDSTLLRLISNGSTRLSEMEQELSRLKNDKSQKEYVRFLKKDITKERQRSHKTVNAIRTLTKRIGKGGNINTRDPEGRTLIMLVAGLGNDKATELVLKDNPDLSLIDSHDRIALDYELRSGGSALTDYIKSEWEVAVTAQDANAIQKILDSGADANWTLKTGQKSALEIAITNKKNALVRQLLMHGAKADGMASTGSSLVELAIEQNNIEALLELLRELKDTNIILSDGSTLFQQLMKTESADCLGEWLSIAASNNQTELPSGASYFCMIIRFTSSDCAKEVAKKNAKLVSREDKEGNLPLHEAARRGDVELYRTLKELGASPSQKNTRGETVLMHAALCANADMLNEAIKDSPPEILKAKDQDGHTARYYADLVKDKAATAALKAAGL